MLQLAQLSAMIKLGGSILRRFPLGIENVLPFKLVDSVGNSCVKELNTVPKKLKNKSMDDLLIHKHMSMFFLLYSFPRQ